MSSLQRTLTAVALLSSFWALESDSTAQSPVVREPTPVKLVLAYPVVFSAAHIGDIVNWQVTEDVVVNGITVIQRGASATTRVNTISSVGSTPDIGLRLEYVNLRSGAAVPIRNGPEAPDPMIIHFSSQNSRGTAVREGTQLTVFVAGFVLDSTETLAQSNAAEHAAEFSHSRLILPDGTPIRLRLSQTISSEDADVGDHVGFEVMDEVRIGNLIVVPKGGYAWGTVTEAKPKGNIGRGGKLSINLDFVRLSSGEKAALRAVRNKKGGGHKGAMAGAMVATTVVFWPAAPLWLFVQGKDTTMKQGNEITAYTNGDTPLDRNKWFGAAESQLTAGTIALSTVQIAEGPAVARRRAFIGASGVNGAKGVVLTEIDRGSPADRAGLRVGDTITTVDGKPIPTTATLASELNTRVPGAKIRVSYIRYGVPRTSILTTGGIF